MDVFGQGEEAGRLRGADAERGSGGEWRVEQWGWFGRVNVGRVDQIELASATYKALL
jgi:hypothetical protein